MSIFSSNKIGSIGSRYSTHISTNEKSPIVEVREKTLIVRGVHYSDGRHFGLGFIELDFDDVVSGYENQNNPSLKEHYNTNGIKVRVVVDELMSINDFFGDNPTDDEILSFKVFTESKTIEINPTKVYGKSFNQLTPNLRMNRWDDFIISGIKEVMLDKNKKNRNELRGVMVRKEEEMK
jgi:hypothetical protein